MRKEYDFSKGQRGSVLSTAGKTRVPIWLEDEVYAFFCAKAEELGCGFQGLINEALKDAINRNKSTVEESEHY